MTHQYSFEVTSQARADIARGKLVTGHPSFAYHRAQNTYWWSRAHTHSHTAKWHVYINYRNMKGVETYITVSCEMSVEFMYIYGVYVSILFCSVFQIYLDNFVKPSICVLWVTIRPPSEKGHRFLQKRRETNIESADDCVLPARSKQITCSTITQHNPAV